VVGLDNHVGFLIVRSGKVIPHARRYARLPLIKRFHRRDALLLAATTLAGLAAASCRTRRQRAPWESGPRLPNGHPILRVPFPAGAVVLCQQGNLSPPGRTHFKENNRYALDLSNTTSSPLIVVSAAPGRAISVYSDADPADKDAGLGYGNQLKIEHGDGYFTMYAHLDKVSVRDGDVVESGAPLGTVGFTGAAGNRHLHFSLHQGPPGKLGVHESSAMDALVTVDVAESAEFRAMSSTDLRDGRTALWDGVIYGSENTPSSKPLFGAAPAELAAELASGRVALEKALADRRALDTVSREWSRRDSEWALGVLTPILARVPRHAVARYWLATAILRPQQRVPEAEVVYADLLTSGAIEPTWETWLVAWCHNRIGTIALEKGLLVEARAHFAEAARRATAEPERSFAEAALGRLDARPDGG